MSEETLKKLTTLPYYAALKNYDENKWAVFGTCTYRYKQKHEQKVVDDCRQLIYQIADVNDTWPERLSWFVRIEGGHKKGEYADSHSINNGLHFHFLLGCEKVTKNAKFKTFTKNKAARFLQKEWDFGRRLIEPYETGIGGLEYVLKARLGAESQDYDDRIVISAPLMTELKKAAGTAPKSQMQFDFAGRGDGL